MRINVIPPKFLADQHLCAAYREQKMLAKALVRSIKSKKGIDYSKLPERYTLNTNHGKFFYDKLRYIEQNFNEIIKEMKVRGFATNHDKLYDENYDYSAIDTSKSYTKVWHPDYEDYRVNSERILLRVSEKDGWYKYYGKTMSYDEFHKMYVMNNLI